MFANVNHFNPRLIYTDEAGAHTSGAFRGSLLLEEAPKFASKCKPKVKVTNTLAYYV